MVTVSSRKPGPAKVSPVGRATGRLTTREYWRPRYGDKLELVSPVPRLPDYYKKYVTRQNLLLVYSGNQDDLDGFGAFVVRVARPLE